MFPIKPRLVVTALLLAVASAPGLHAADRAAPSPPPASVDEGTQKRADGKAARLVDAARVTDTAAAARARGVLAQWFLTLWSWHDAHDAELKDLWSQWSQARSVVPKDEFPAEVIAHRIDDVYASLRPAYQVFIARLGAELTSEQVAVIKETWSRSPGMQRTYQAYLEIVPDLNEEQKKVIHDRLYQAREDAMLTDADREIVNIYKRHKVKVEAYVGSLQWTKLHRAYANRGK